MLHEFIMKLVLVETFSRSFDSAMCALLTFDGVCGLIELSSKLLVQLKP